MQVWAVDGSTKYAIRNRGRDYIEAYIIILVIFECEINSSI